MIVIQGTHHCTAQIVSKSHEHRLIEKDLLDLISTNQWSENNKYVESEAGAGGGEEDRDRRNLNDGGSDGDRDEQLDGDDGIDLADERPTELGALQHHRVERRLSRLQIMLLVPHIFRIRLSTPATKSSN